MKMMKLIYPLTLAWRSLSPPPVAETTNPYGVTPIPNGQGGQVGERGSGRHHGRQSARRRSSRRICTDFDNMTEDRAALAAYTIHFAFDSAAIRQSEEANLQSVASALSSDPSTKLLIEGNCDERGTEEYNRSLGERRALAAREALAKLGVDPTRVRTMSYGKDKPVDPGHDESAWSQNRRDDFVLLHPKTGA